MEYIFPLSGLEGKLKEIGGHCDKDCNVPTYMLFGFSKSCKTYLLMQTAVTVAGDETKVLFVSPQKLSRLPSSVHGMKQPCISSMKHIQFLYAKNYSELQAYLSSIHLRPQEEIPSVIIVDELNHYCLNSEDSDPLNQLVLFVKLSSLIQEAIFYTSSKLGQSNQQSKPKENRPLKLAMMSWTLGTNESSLKMPELEDVANRIDNCECWKINNRSKKESSNGLFELSRQSGSNEKLLVNFCLRQINPKLDVIYFEDIFIEKNEEQILNHAMANPKSFAWQYFVKNSNEESATCKQCNHTLMCRGWSIGRLIRHLQKRRSIDKLTASAPVDSEICKRKAGEDCEASTSTGKRKKTLLTYFVKQEKKNSGRNCL